MERPLTGTSSPDALRAAGAALLASPPLAMAWIAWTFDGPWVLTALLLVGPALDLGIVGWSTMRLMREDRVLLPAAFGVTAGLVGLVFGVMMSTGWGVYYLMLTVGALPYWSEFDHTLREASSDRVLAWAAVSALSAVRATGWAFIAGKARARRAA